MSVPKGFRQFHRNTYATKLGVTINQRTGHLMFNTLAKRELLDLLDTDHTTELTFFFDDESKRIYMTPAKQGERGWKLNPNNGMVSAAKVRDWMMDHDYEPGVQYSLIPHERGWIIEPETTVVQRAARKARHDAVSHVHARRTERESANTDNRAYAELAA